MQPLVEYRRYRAALIDLHTKISEAFVTPAIYNAAIATLGLGTATQVIVDHESDLDVLAEYTIYESRREGDTCVERYTAQISGSKAIERELLDGMRRARLGVFRIEGVSQTRNQADLRELAGGSRRVTLTDVGLSNSVRENDILVMRPIELTNMAMSSGLLFGFRPQYERELVERWEKWSEPTRFARCFKFFKRCGQPTVLIPPGND
jgi:hypothetical protein